MSQAQAAAAQTNGAMSHGPITPEGKARSARNSTKHGLNSTTVVLVNESSEEYAGLLADYLSRYAPEGPAEIDLIHEIAATRWRLRRIVRMESSLFDRQIEAALDASPDADLDIAALDTLAGNSKPLALLGRYESRLRRSYEKALLELKALQTARKQAEETNEQNEPKVRNMAVPQTRLSPVLAAKQNEPAIDIRPFESAQTRYQP